jgi:hypothetical protein
MGFFVCFFILFCIGLCLERRDYRRRAKKYKANSSNGINFGNSPSKADAPSPRALLDTFGDGVFEVGVDIAPGTYRSPGGDPSIPTIWHRLRDFSGEGIIAEGGCAGPCIVTISETDQGFESLNSGGWKRIDQEYGGANP